MMINHQKKKKKKREKTEVKKKKCHIVAYISDTRSFLKNSNASSLSSFIEFSVLKLFMLFSFLKILFFSLNTFILQIILNVKIILS